MAEELQEETIGEPFEKGFIQDFWECPADLLIVKINGSLDGNMLELRVVINANHTGELYFNDSSEMLEGDTIWAEPDGLVILKQGATTEQITPIDGRIVQIGSYFDGTFLSHPTIEPIKK